MGERVYYCGDILHLDLVTPTGEAPSPKFFGGVVGYNEIFAPNSGVGEGSGLAVVHVKQSVDLDNLKSYVVEDPNTGDPVGLDELLEWLEPCLSYETVLLLGCGSSREKSQPDFATCLVRALQKPDGSSVRYVVAPSGPSYLRRKYHCYATSDRSIYHGGTDWFVHDGESRLMIPLGRSAKHGYEPIGRVDLQRLPHGVDDLLGLVEGAPTFKPLSTDRPEVKNKDQAVIKPGQVLPAYSGNRALAR